MPAVRKASREQIIDAAVAVLRDDGFSAINARSVAKKLGCSTQPIYFSFKNMDELKAALTERAIELHTQRVRDSLRAHEGSDSRYSSYGMGFVKFAAEEKQLFPLALSKRRAISLQPIKMTCCCQRSSRSSSRNSATARRSRGAFIRI